MYQKWNAMSNSFSHLLITQCRSIHAVLVAPTTQNVICHVTAFVRRSPRPASILNFSVREFQQFHPIDILRSFAHRYGWPWPMCLHGQVSGAGRALWWFVGLFRSPFVFAESCKIGHNRWNFAVYWSIYVFLSMLLSVQIAVLVNCWTRLTTGN